MRKNLQQARKDANKTQKETAAAIGISERFYQHIEGGTREGKGQIWDSLEELFDFKYSQRELRYNHPPDASVPCTARKRNRKAA